MTNTRLSWKRRFFWTKCRILYRAEPSLAVAPNWGKLLLLASVERSAMRQGQGSAGHRPDAPNVDELDCLVGGIVVTCRETVSRVKRCTGGRHEWRIMCPQMGPQTMGQKMRSLETRCQKNTCPNLRWSEGMEEKSLNLVMLESLWGWMRKANSRAIEGKHLVNRARESRKCRHGVAHARKTRRNTAARNGRRGKEHDAGTLARYLAHVRTRLARVNHLYAHLGLAPMG